MLKSTSIPPYHTTSSNSGKEDCYFFFVYSQAVPPYIPARTPNPPDRWLLDRGIVNGGTVVPQTMWSPKSVTDKRLHVETAELQMPVFFEEKDGGLGLSLGTCRTCIDGRCRVLRDPTVPAPLGQKSTTHIRIVVSMAFGLFVVTSNSFAVNISGLVIKSLSGKSHFVTSRERAFPSPWLGLLIRSGGRWIIFLRSVASRHHVQTTCTDYRALLSSFVNQTLQVPTSAANDGGSGQVGSSTATSWSSVPFTFLRELGCR